MYKLSRNIDPNRVFILQKSELEGRFDPFYYADRIDIKNAIKLSSLVETKGGKRLPKGYYYSDEATDFRYLRVDNIKEFGQINWNETKFISQEIYEILKRYKIEKDDVIISIAGTVGKIACIDKNIENVILTENCAKLQVKDKAKILPKYLEILLGLSTSAKQIQLGFIQTTIPKLGLDKIEQIKLPPIPSVERQLEIIAIVEKAIKQSQQKEAKARKLLASIDNYLLGELGIKMPISADIAEPVSYRGFELDKQNPMVKNGRLFLTGIREIGGGRFDPVNSLYLGRKSKSTIYENVFLREIATIGKGQSITSKEIIDGKYPVIAGGQSSPYSHKEFNNDPNVITVSASGAYAGFLWYHDYPIFASDCSVIRSENENDFSTKFIFEVLKAKQKEIYLLQQGAGQPHVYPADLAKIYIPVVPINIQNKITCHINSLREQAQLLQQQATHALQQAKEKIEKMILA